MQKAPLPLAVRLAHFGEKDEQTSRLGVMIVRIRKQSRYHESKQGRRRTKYGKSGRCAKTAQ